MSEKNIYQRMIEVQKIVQSVEKNSVVKMFENDKGYKAVTHDDVARALHLPLAECGVVMVPDVVSYAFTSFEKPNYQGKLVTWHRADIEISVKWINADKPEDFFASKSAAFAIDTSDKSFAKAYSLALKIALLKVHLLESRDDEESRPFENENGIDSKGNSTTKNQNKPTQKKQTQPEPQQKTVLDPKDFIMPFGKTTKGKKLGSLSLETLNDVLQYTDGELKKENSTAQLNNYLVLKANLLKVISTFNLEKKDEQKPDVGDSIIEIEFDTVENELVKGKTLKMIPEKTLLAMIQELDKKMQSVPPPKNLTALFSINSKIKEFLKSCGV